MISTATRHGHGLLKRLWGEKKHRLLMLMAGVFLVAFFVPWSTPRVSAAVNEAFLMLGVQLGSARAVGAIVFAFVIGLLMQLIFLKEDKERTTNAAMFESSDDDESRVIGKTVIYLASMVGTLVFLNWAPSGGLVVWWDFLHQWRWAIVGLFGVALIYALVRWFTKSELGDWVRATRDFAVQILPLLFGGVLVAGFLLGRPEHVTLIPESWVAGALMYLATLTEVPIMQGLLGAGMNQGPALALLLAGPSLSLPSLFAIGGELGVRKTLVYVILVVVLSTEAGMIYGNVIVQEGATNERNSEHPDGGLPPSAFVRDTTSTRLRRAGSPSGLFAGRAHPTTIHESIRVYS